MIAKQEYTPELRFSKFSGNWTHKKLKEVFSISSGATPRRSDKRFFDNGTIPWVKTTDLNNSEIHTTEELISEIALAETSVRKNPINSVMVAMYGGFNQIGRTGILKVEAATNQALSVIRPSDEIDSLYLLHYLNRNVGLWRRFAGSSRKDPNITGKDVGDFPIVFPTLEEQRKIAEFLGAVDSKLDALRRKRALLAEYKRGVMQKLFTQEIRFVGDGKRPFPDWEDGKVGDVTENFSIRNKQLHDYEVYSVTNTQGFILQSDQFDRQVAGQDLSNYKIIKRGEFAYNPARVNVGSIAQFEDENGIISSLYVCFRMNGRMLDKFFSHWLELRKTVFDINRYGEGGVRVYLWFPLFASINIPIPSPDEQKKIADFLTAIDDKITAVDQQIEKMETFKKGLLQQLFV